MIRRGKREEGRGKREERTGMLLKHIYE